MGHPEWLTPLYNPALLIESANILAEQINHDKQELQIDAIVVTGVSGITMGGIISYLTNIPLIVLRKKDDKSTHSGYKLECSYCMENKVFNYIIIDDLICSGYTIIRIINEIKNSINSHCKLSKIYLYKDLPKDTIEIDFEKYPVFAFNLNNDNTN